MLNHISSVLDLRKCEVFLGSLRRARGPTRRLCHRSCNPAAAPDYILTPLVFFQAGSALLMTQSRSFASEKTRLSGVHHVWSLLISCSVSDGEHTRTSSPGLIGAIVVAHPGFEWQTTHFSAKGGNRGKPTRTPQRRPKSAKAHATGGKPKQDPAGHSASTIIHSAAGLFSFCGEIPVRAYDCSIGSIFPGAGVY